MMPDSDDIAGPLKGRPSRLAVATHAGVVALLVILGIATLTGPVLPRRTPSDFTVSHLPLPPPSKLGVPRIQQPALPPPPKPATDEEVGVTLARGDTLMGVLVKAGLDRQIAHGAITALKPLFDPRAMRPGQTLTLRFAPRYADRANEKEGGASGDLKSITFAPDAFREIRLVVDSAAKTGFSAEKEVFTLVRKVRRARGTINSSLYVSAVDAGVPPAILVRLIRIYSWGVDFQREIRRGDTFDAAFEQFYLEDGTFARNGNVLFASLTLSGGTQEVYRFKRAKGEADYFDAKGRSVRKALMRTPIDGARLSSSFGRRKHPILGYTRMHTGVDFAAPSGTPIYAAGSGVVSYRGWKGGYGRYVRIRHNSTYSTAYAHMSRYARRATRGARVQQGQVIGYVGTSGRSTGPHLHYEVHVSGKKINPMRLKLPSGKPLKGKELANFREHMSGLTEQLAELVPPKPVARTE